MNSSINGRRKKFPLAQELRPRGLVPLICDNETPEESNLSGHGEHKSPQIPGRKTRNCFERNKKPLCERRRYLPDYN